MSTFSYRTAQPQDYHNIIALWQAAGLDHRPAGRDSEQAMTDEMDRDCAWILLAFEGDQMAGSIVATHDGRRGWINRLAVDPEYRGQGLARELIDRAETWLKDQGLGILVCLISEDNSMSRTLFQSCDYVEHREIVYYSKRLRPDI